MQFGNQNDQQSPICYWPWEKVRKSAGFCSHQGENT